MDPSEFVICRRADGSEICLGEGNFGKGARLSNLHMSLCFRNGTVRPCPILPARGTA